MKQGRVATVIILLTVTLVACDSSVLRATPTPIPVVASPASRPTLVSPSPIPPTLVPDSVLLVSPCSAKDKISFPSRAIPLLRENVGKASEQKRLSYDSVIQALLSPDGKNLIVASKYDVSIYATEDLSLVRTLASYDATYSPLIALSPDGKTLAFHYGVTITLWPLTDESPVRTIRQSADTMAFSPNHDWLAVGLADSRIILWNIQDGAKSDINDYSAEQLAYSPDGKLLAVSTLDSDSPQARYGLGYNEFHYPSSIFGKFSLYRLTDGEKVRQLLFTHPPVRYRDLEFSPDGTTLAAGAWLWRVSDGTAICSLDGLVESAAPIGDGKLIFVEGSTEGVVVKTLNWQVAH